MNPSKKSTVIVLSCLAAATAGITAIIAISRWRAHSETEQGVTNGLRNMQEVLADCYSKINEIEKQLPPSIRVAEEEISPVMMRSVSHHQGASNGKPAYDAS